MGTLQNQGSWIPPSPALSLFLSPFLYPSPIPISVDVLTEHAALWHLSPTQFLWAFSISGTGAYPGVGAGRITGSRGRREVFEGVSGEDYDFHLPEESLLLIPGRTRRGEGTIISFPDG